VRRTRAPPPPAGATPPAGLARGGASSAPATPTILKECGKSHTFLAGKIWQGFIFGGKFDKSFFLAGTLTRRSFWREIIQSFLFGGKFDKAFFLAGKLTSLAEISENFAQNLKTFVGKLDKIATELLIRFWWEVDKLSMVKWFSLA
jgi:hypothetical protein